MESQLTCKKCGKSISPDYAACPFCGQKITKTQSSKPLFTVCIILAGAIILLLAYILLPLLNINVSTLFVSTTPTPIPSPSPIVEKTFSDYGLVDELLYKDFVDKWNYWIDSLKKELGNSVTQIQNNANELTINDDSMERFITYDLDDGVSMKVWAIGKKLYITRLQFIGKSQHIDYDLHSTSVMFVFLQSAPYGGEFLIDMRKNNNYASFSETIMGYKFSAFDDGKIYRIDIVLRKGN